MTFCYFFRTQERSELAGGNSTTHTSLPYCFERCLTFSDWGKDHFGSENARKSAKKREKAGFCDFYDWPTL